MARAAGDEFVASAGAELADITTAKRNKGKSVFMLECTMPLNENKLSDRRLAARTATAELTAPTAVGSGDLGCRLLLWPNGRIIKSAKSGKASETEHQRSRVEKEKRKTAKTTQAGH